jgi:hypothetical protein
MVCGAILIEAIGVARAVNAPPFDLEISHGAARIAVRNV